MENSSFYNMFCSCSVGESVNLFIHIPHSVTHTHTHTYIFLYFQLLTHTAWLLLSTRLRVDTLNEEGDKKIIQIMCLIKQKVSAVISLNCEAFSFYNVSSCLTWRRWWERGPPAQLSREVIYAHAAEIYWSKQWCKERDRNTQRNRERRGQRLAPVCRPAGRLSSNVSERFDLSFTPKNF